MSGTEQEAGSRSPLAEWLTADDVSLRAFVGSVVHHLCVDMYRTARRQKGSAGSDPGILLTRSDADEFRVQTDDGASAFRSSAQEQNFFARRQADERQQMYSLALGVLSPRQLKVLEDIRAGLEQEKIAASLGVTPGRISQIKTDAIKALRGALESLGLTSESEGDTQ